MLKHRLYATSCGLKELSVSSFGHNRSHFSRSARRQGAVVAVEVDFCRIKPVTVTYRTEERSP
jgi:hypothetical protein